MNIGIELESSVSSSTRALRSSILAEEVFCGMLCLERKRAERSGRRLVLLLLESESVREAARKLALEKTARVLSQSARDTDVTGWYHENEVLGVLFTEIAATEAPFVDVLSDRIHRALVDALGPEQAREIKASFHVFPDDFHGTESARRVFPLLYPDLEREVESTWPSRAMKRAIDVLGSFALIVLLLPLLVAIACLVKFTSRGPILFRQYRLGQFGEKFTFLKFRSMYAQTDHSIHQDYIKRFIRDRGSKETANGGAVFKLKNDPRITKVGAFLRRTSLDELPQLFNVLSGKMSLVGPRPALPYEFESYEIWHRRRLLVKPGITGFWQVDGRSRVTFDDMVRMDLRYATYWSLGLDMRILLRTPRAVLSGNGAY